MSTKKVSHFKSTLEIIGLVAVVLGLVFVGIEVRQNTAAVQAQTLQGLNDSSQEFLLLLASDAELVEIQQKAHKVVLADQFVTFVESSCGWQL